MYSLMYRFVLNAIIFFYIYVYIRFTLQCYNLENFYYFNAIVSFDIDFEIKNNELCRASLTDYIIWKINYVLYRIFIQDDLPLT